MRGGVAVQREGGDARKPRAAGGHERRAGLGCREKMPWIGETWSREEEWSSRPDSGRLAEEGSEGGIPVEWSVILRVSVPRLAGTHTGAVGNILRGLLGLRLSLHASPRRWTGAVDGKHVDRRKQLEEKGHNGGAGRRRRGSATPAVRGAVKASVSEQRSRVGARGEVGHGDGEHSPGSAWTP